MSVMGPIEAETRADTVVLRGVFGTTRAKTVSQNAIFPGPASTLFAETREASIKPMQNAPTTSKINPMSSMARGVTRRLRARANIMMPGGTVNQMGRNVGGGAGAAFTISSGTRNRVP